ncbi:MAG: hypothetical protein ACOCP8_04785 [archaeon]
MISEEGTNVIVGTVKEGTVESIKGSAKLTSEIIKAFMLKMEQKKNTDQSKEGKNSIKKLLSAGNNVGVPIKIDKQDIKQFSKLAKDYKMPVSILKGKNGYRIFFRERDKNKVSEMMKDIIMSKTQQDTTKMKQIILSKENAIKFKEKMKDKDVNVNFLDKKNGRTKIVFDERDSLKIEAVVDGIKKDNKLISKPLNLNEKVDRFEKNINFTNDPDSIKGYKFSKISLKDKDNTQMMTIYNKDKYLSYSTLKTDQKGFLKDIKERFGLNEKDANDILDKANKMGFIKDYEKNINKDTLKNVKVSRDNKTQEFVYKLNNKEYRSKNETKKEVTQGIMNKFNINKNDANAIYKKGAILSNNYNKGIQKHIDKANKNMHIHKTKTTHTKTTHSKEVGVSR